ncbi:MAG: glutathione S-transferase [Alphaproteobacteria bacterium HGW-Alphaproteobacteria-17]|nr:MAG: glutathione S-transferase [Alphaproteobacteria bacterium HGW-Alphaproteobacteria-17]
MIKLYGTPPTRALRAIWLLNELDLPHEVVPVDLSTGEQLTPEFLALNPAAKLPVLVDGDMVISESAAIQLYLADKYGDRFPGGGLIPATAEDRGRMYHWLFFLMTEIEAPLWRIALHNFIYEAGDQSATEPELAKRDALRMIVVLEQHMQGRDYLVGNAPTVADFNAAFTLDWAREEALLDDAPALRTYLDALYARPRAPVTIAEGFAALGIEDPSVAGAA